MLEVYLFVNPLGSTCYTCEQQVNRVAAQTKSKLQIQFVPMLTLQTISETFHRLNAQHPGTIERNQLAQQMYQIIMDYKAASFQGKRLGRQFFLQLQGHLLEQHEVYTEALGRSVAEALGLDLEMFDDDRHSKLAEEAFASDQHLVSEMNIDHPGETVIFDVDDFDYGLLMDEFDYETLFEISEHASNTNIASLSQAVEHMTDKANLRVL
ncbi:DsbA family protein [Furfurilactobacillus sp. WILCCON 0119]|uniref:DsbA family protein n=1 Tax=Furfurilactobacillus entadae TaxID=2922307 RepID=UPI0035E542FA